MVDQHSVRGAWEYVHYEESEFFFLNMKAADESFIIMASRYIRPLSWWRNDLYGNHVVCFWFTEWGWHIFHIFFFFSIRFLEIGRAIGVFWESAVWEFNQRITIWVTALERVQDLKVFPHSITFIWWVMTLFFF